MLTWTKKEAHNGNYYFESVTQFGVYRIFRSYTRPRDWQPTFVVEGKNNDYFYFPTTLRSCKSRCNYHYKQLLAAMDEAP